MPHPESLRMFRAGPKNLAFDGLFWRAAVRTVSIGSDRRKLQWLSYSDARLMLCGFVDALRGHYLRGCERFGTQGEEAHHVVCDGEPQQMDAGLELAAQGELAQTHAAGMGIDAFVLAAQPIEGLAFLALHALAPVRNANTVTFLWGIRVGAMLGLRWRAPHLYIVGMGPLDVVIFGEATIDQIVGWVVAFRVRHLDPRLRQAAIGAAGIDIDRNDHLLFRRRYDLRIIGRAPPAIGHLHYPCVGIGGRSARRLLLGHLVLVGL